MFFWLSGAGTETLEQCPNWEQRKYVAFGATVLVPCAFAFIACAYALSTLTDNNWVIFPVAGVWAFIILTIDRALLASYRPFLSPLKKFGQFSLRFVVAGLMGLTIAHPLVLLLFKDTVSGVIETARSEQVQKTREYFKVQKDDELKKIRTHEAAIAKQRERWNDSFNAKFLVTEDKKDDSDMAGLTPEQQTELKASIAEATKTFSDRVTAIDTEVAKLSPQYTKIQQELAMWQEQFEKEVNGQRSGIRGLGPRARSIRDDQLAWRRTEATRLGEQLKHLTSEKSGLLASIAESKTTAIAAFEKKLEADREVAAQEEARVAALRRKVQSDQADQFVGQQNALRATIKTQIDSMLVELKRMQEGLASVAADERASIAAIVNEPRKDILTQTLALHHLFQQGKEGGQFAFTTYWILTSLFMLVDTIPLMVKFFCKAGPYDKLLDRDEIQFDSEHKAFIKSHHRYMEQLGEGDLIAVTRNKTLENALVDGVEHSRAARAFLDSMIELERSFHEKMQAEQAIMANAGPEKHAVIEAMKKGFYDDMHRRMEQFFAHSHSVAQ
ncbi:hypothetical protein NT6N_18590 [Oceaniferula spumae]|uniref:DUF4407 domain-containing protein n=1 Tax=Oceaniferula spumae TaxID=2979115 RepID=A0AAT9FLC2_9BACT